MTESDGKPAPAPAPGGDRIAKHLSRAGIASRRDAERMIAEGRVSVNGKVVASPAVNVTPKDRITVDGAAVGPIEAPRLWLYHKPVGLVTTARDEKGRETVFDKLPPDLPRVMTVGRLDLTSEGLLLLTNDGGLKRRLELPSTGWLRRYRARVNGTPDDAALEPLRKGIEIDGEAFQPMEVSIDRQQGANAWLTIALREGKNREIRRAIEAVGMQVNRLIRISYGPFRLGTLKAGEVEEVRPRVLRDQLGIEAAAEPVAKARKSGKPVPAGEAGRGPKAGGGAPERRTGGKSGATERRGAEGASERPARSFGGKPGRPGGGPRAERSEDGGRPARGTGGTTAAPRGGAFAGERPARSFGGKAGKPGVEARAERSEGGGGSARGPAGKTGAKRGGGSAGERPARSFGGKPGAGQRAERAEGGGRPPRGPGGRTAAGAAKGPGRGPAERGPRPTGAGGGPRKGGKPGPKRG